MNRGTAALGIALVTTGIILAVALLIPIEIRHTAPFGFRQTLDRSRGIAVNGVTVTSNYANFNRIDLDLRAYTEQERYDFIVRIRPLTEDAEAVRSVRITRPYDEIAVNKAALADPFSTVRFDPIADSSGKSYYVWVERGPRNQDDIVALWSVKSYSRLRGTAALTAFITGVPVKMPQWAGWGVLVGLMVLFIAAFAALILSLGRWAWYDAWGPTASPATYPASESPP